MDLREEFDPERCLNPNVRGLSASATVAINERSNRLRRQGRQVFKLGLGQSPFPVPDPVVDELKANAHRKDYLQVVGLAALREAVADYHRRHQGVAVSADRVVVGPGSKELMFLLQVAFNGDLVIPTPAWVSYAPQARVAGRTVRFLETQADNGWRLTPDQIEEYCEEDGHKPRILILNYPSNPTGRTYQPEELEALARTARRHRIVLLSDEIYGELHHEGRHHSVAQHYPEGTIISSGLSKWCGAGGWRLGTFSFPSGLDWLREAIATLASETYTSTSAPIQFAAVRAFQGGAGIESYLWTARRVLKAVGLTLHTRLVEGGFRVAAPEGAFYLFVDFGPFADALAARGMTRSPQVTEKLLEDTGVAILPGADFGRDPAELTARLAYVDFDGARAMAAADQASRDQDLGTDYVAEYARDLVTAVERMVAWVRGEAA